MSRAQEATEFSGHFHAATYELVLRLAALDDSGEWQGVGFRDCAHWLSVHAGFQPWIGRDLLRVGQALKQLPVIAAAFAEGRLSFDKVSALVKVANPEDEAIWLDIALAASVTQLSRICTAFRRAAVIDDPNRHALQQAARTFNAWWLEDGMLRLVATLPPEEGRLVLNAVEDAVLEPPDNTDLAADEAAARDGGERPAALAEHPAHDLFGARRADALTRVCERWLCGAGRDDAARKAPRQLVVHIDVETLLDTEVEGRCHLEDGPAIAAAMARRIGCDSEVLTLIERGGAPLDLQRTRRAVAGKLRRALQLRDGYCRYPACRVPARDCDGHHIKAWCEGGLTRLPNLISLCEFHHQRFHEAAFQIVGDANQAVEFRTPGGEPIQPAARPMLMPGMTGTRWLQQLSALAGRQITANTPTAKGYGERFDLGLTVELLAESIARSAARASPN